MALELLALALWIPLGLFGLWLLVTGRHTIFGLPRGFKAGWQLRAFGLAYVLLAGYPSYRAIHDGYTAADAVVFGYLGLVTLVLILLYQWWKVRRAEAAGPLS